MKKVLVVSKGAFHPTVFCRMQLHKIVNRLTDINPDFTNKINLLNGIDPTRIDTVVFYFHEKHIERETLDSLVTYVNDGGTLLCIHGSLASFKTYPKYQQLTGAQFTGHEKIRDMDITGIFTFTIKDEPYEFELDDDCEILLENKSLPVCWVKYSGKGKVVGLTPGHKLETIKTQAFENMIEYILNKF